MNVTPTAHDVIGLDPSRRADRADRDMARVLDALESLDIKPIETCSVAEARAQPTPADAAALVMRAKGISTVVPGVRARDTTYQGATGTLAARIYTPEGDGTFPVVLYFRRGGFVIGSLDAFDATPRSMAARSGAIFVSADYAMAPEHRFPAAHDDAFAAYRWVIDTAASFGGDPDRIAVMGECAGGNLAANVAIDARDHDLPAPRAQILVYPLASSRVLQSADIRDAGARPLTLPMLSWFMDKLLAAPGDIKSPMLNLVGADLRDLPPATIINAGIDPLASDGEKLARRLRDAGNRVANTTYPGVTHAFFGMAGVVRAAAEAQALAAARLAEAFARPGPVIA
jgi:acetyl esterase/lipase